MWISNVTEDSFKVYTVPLGSIFRLNKHTDQQVSLDKIL